MAKICSICGRGSLKANSRSHSNIATIKRQKVNLQTLFKDNKRIIACASCIKSEMKKSAKK
ncbi:MAG: 50S ribosomal protein L28 [Candidatus Kerfeldbacteria bacterium CG08_land_8_20_14_0_20_43_14]|uniref:50S ribosomal protein L28 n=1 Tax=Candidatus Kerfeldbacteria bacterium CG08_land_8_20_14_0_20_43_14 TaxID=2014246 RepID=A0A2H0YPU7_9BACT|nr:MAG: 50S ribosomal protein L28 [Candidatus Kerfeldbacteria bacterium CG08_land_8_20_14_0_20_43_14]